MPRFAPSRALLILIVACAPTDEPGAPAGTILAGDGVEQVTDPSWSPDGTRLAFSLPVEGRSAIFVTDADGGNRVQLTNGVWDSDPIWSPDGAWIAYYSDEGYDVMVVPSTGGESRQLTSGPATDAVAGWTTDGTAVIVERRGVGATQTYLAPLDGGPLMAMARMEGAALRAFPSPDGRRAVLQVERQGQRTIWVQDLPDGTPRQLTTEGFEDPHTPSAWSPDSRWILYESRRTGTSDLWVVNAETGETRQLTTDIREDRDGRWSPDGQWILFRSTRGGQPDLWVIPATGGDAIRLTNDQPEEGAHSWAPDGRSVLYLRLAFQSRLVALPMDGGLPRAIVAWDNGAIGDPRPTADGQAVLFTGKRSGTADLWTVPFGGGEPRLLVSSPGTDTAGVWSPDGSRIAFVSTRGGTEDIWIADSAGGQLRQLTDWTPSSELSPVWSPDGTRLAFLSTRDAVAPELWTMAADGSGAVRMVPGREASNPFWSPDGQTLFFVGESGAGGSAVFAIPAVGGVARMLTPADQTVNFATLSPDGRSVAYSRFADGWAYLETIPVEGGTPRRLTQQTERVYQTGPTWAPDGSALLVEDWDFVTSFNTLSLYPLTGEPSRQLPTSAGTFTFGHRWAPDGRTVVAVEFKSDPRIVSLTVAGLLRAP